MTGVSVLVLRQTRATGASALFAQKGKNEKGAINYGDSIYAEGVEQALLNVV